MKAKVKKTGEIIDVVKNQELDAHYWVNSKTGYKYYKAEIEIVKNKVMKSNEAPEKIYLIRNISTSTSLNTTNDCHEKYLQEWYKGREKDADIEYVRTDAFIKKARKYFIKELPNFRSFMESGTTFIKNFESFIRGE